MGLFNEAIQVLKKTKEHSNPDAWLISHYLSYLMRYTDSFRKETENFINQKKFNQNCVGIHIRRSDKIMEAKYYKLSEYMKQVAIYYSKTMFHGNETEKCVVLITDEMGLVNETKR